MALLFMDSFDHYATADITEKWTQLGAGTNDASAIAAVGRRSSNGWKMTTTSVAAGNTSSALAKTLSPADNKIVVGVAFKSVTAFAGLDTGTNSEIASSTAVFLSIRHAAVTQCWLRLNTDGTLSLFRGTTVVGTSSAALSQGVYTYVELMVTVHGTTGTVDLRFNGVSVLSLASQNTQNGASALWSELRMGSVGQASGAAGEWNLDDLYVCDGAGSAPWNTFLGDCRVDVRQPTAEGASSAWTPSSGSDNALMVDETAPNDDTDYNGSATVGHTDTFVVPDAPVAGSTIYGIQHVIGYKKMDAGSCTITPIVRHSSVDYAGAALAPSTSYAYGLQVAQVNPGTSAAWTDTDFNAAEFGYSKAS